MSPLSRNPLSMNADSLFSATQRWRYSPLYFKQQQGAIIYIGQVSDPVNFAKHKVSKGILKIADKISQSTATNC